MEHAPIARRASGRARAGGAPTPQTPQTPQIADRAAVSRSSPGISHRDELGAQLARAVASRSQTHVLQRAHDPTVDPGRRAAALVYVTANRTALVAAYVQARTTHGYAAPTAVSADLPAIERALHVVDCTSNQAAFGPAKRLLAGAINQPPVGMEDAVLAAAVRALNYMEQEIVTEAVTSRSADATQVGTEFTFSDGKPASNAKASVNLKIDKPTEKAKIAVWRVPHDVAEQTIYKWTEWVKKQRNLIAGNPQIAVTDAGPKAKASYAKRITYTFAPGGGAPNWTWYWVADIDEACYETQTEPTSIADMRGKPEIQAIIAQHIFGGAEKHDLKADPQATGGGGHISLDLASGFAAVTPTGTVVSFETLLETLRRLQADHEDLQRRFNQPEAKKTAGESDPINAPWLSDQRMKRGGADVVAEYTKLLESQMAAARKGDLVTPTSAHTALDTFNQRLTNPVTDHDPQRKKQIEDPSAISHYQAVNVEHIGKALGEARVEIRDIPAQTSYAKLMTDLKILEELLDEVRSSTRLEHSARVFA